MEAALLPDVVAIAYDREYPPLRNYQAERTGMDATRHTTAERQRKELQEASR
jgi:hypothetical protein